MGRYGRINTKFEIENMTFAIGCREQNTGTQTVISQNVVYIIFGTFCSHVNSPLKHLVSVQTSGCSMS